MFIHFRKIATPLKPKLSNSLTKLYSHLPLKLKHSPQLKLPSQHSPETLTRPQLKALVLSHFSRGKFFDLFQNVVASPSVLLTASQNLITPPLSNAPDSLPVFDLVSNCFSVEVMARELSENRFDFGACCVRMVPSEEKGTQKRRQLKEKLIPKLIFLSASKRDSRDFTQLKTHKCQHRFSHRIHLDVRYKRLRKLAYLLFTTEK